MKRVLKVAQFGLGPIGQECLKLVATKPWARVVGAIDSDPAKVGKDIRALCGIPHLKPLRVCGAVPELREKPDLIFHTAVSRLDSAFSQLVPILARGINIVSSCEELLFPQLRWPRLAARLQVACRRSGARLLGTGVNPGFVMDLLPLVLSGVTRRIDAIHVQRVVNASTRRKPLQTKIGSSLAPEEFRRLFRTGKAGHAGLKESVALIVHALGYRIKSIRSIIETGDAIVAAKPIETAFLRVRRGQTCGLHQRAEACIPGGPRISLDLKMYLDANNPHDAIQIEGDPPLDLLVRGGIAGDPATVAALVNAAPRLMRMPPGLRLISELPAG